MTYHHIYNTSNTTGTTNGTGAVTLPKHSGLLHPRVLMRFVFINL